MLWESGAQATVDDILRPGLDCIAAGYSMFGAATELVITYGKGVFRFALDLRKRLARVVVVVTWLLTLSLPHPATFLAPLRPVPELNIVTPLLPRCTYDW